MIGRSRRIIAAKFVQHEIFGLPRGAVIVFLR
jgi:hypothetical protein